MAVAGLVVAIGALLVGYLAWRSAHKSNEIARRALEISEAEHEHRELERKARARLAVAVSVVGFEPDDGGVIRLGGSHGNLTLSIAITNAGDRDAGRTKVAVTFLLTTPDTSRTRWADARGQFLPDDAERIARQGDTYVLSRTLDAVGRELGETLYVNLPVEVPRADAVNEHPIRVRVAAEGAEGEATADFPLKIGRDPSR